MHAVTNQAGAPLESHAGHFLFSLLGCLLHHRRHLRLGSEVAIDIHPPRLPQRLLRVVRLQLTEERAHEAAEQRGPELDREENRIADEREEDLRREPHSKGETELQPLVPALVVATRAAGGKMLVVRAERAEV